MSHPSIEFLGPTPRRVPLPVRCHMAFGGALNQMGWALFAFGMCFFWGFFVNCEAISWLSFRGPLNTTAATITRSEKTNASEGGSKSRPGTPIYANHYSFVQDRKEYTGCSYATGRALSSGQSVNIEYSPGNPEISRIQGMRSRMFGAGASMVVIFPIAGLGLMLPGYFLGKKAKRLLECGQLAEAALQDKQPTNTSINKQRVYKLRFEFTASDGRKYPATTRTHQPAKLEDEATEQVIYDPNDPQRALLVDAMPGAFRVDENGNIQPESSRRALLVTILPVLTVLGNFAWAVLRLV